MGIPGNLVVLLAAGTVACEGARASELRVAAGDSVFAIVTHKAGIASGKAHNHFVAAGKYTVRLEGESGSVDGGLFEIELHAEDLVVDDPALQEAWFPRLEALGILDEPFGELEAKDRAKIRESALGAKQLDAAKFPLIKARMAVLVERATTLGDVELGHEVTLVFEVHGKSAERPVAANVTWEDGTLRVEAAGTFRFTDFGIKPFSAFFGAVRNTDEFHVYVHFEASP